MYRLTPRTTLNKYPRDAVVTSSRGFRGMHYNSFGHLKNTIVIHFCRFRSVSSR